MLGQSTTDSEAENNSGVLKEARALWHELSVLTHDRFRLAALETQRAGKTLVVMLVAGLMGAVLLISAWLGLLAAGILYLIEKGILTSTSIILLAVLVNLIAAAMLGGLIYYKSRYLRFPATSRNLKPLSTSQMEPEKSLP